MKGIEKGAVLCLLLLLFAGCASSKAGDVYTRDEARKAQSVEMGIVEAARPVQIEGTKSMVGTVAGAAIGGLAGASIGHGWGSAVGAGVGAVAGGLAGSAIEEEATKKDGVEVTVKLDSGRTISVVQEATEKFYPGDRVRILTNDRGTTRVAR